MYYFELRYHLLETAIAARDDDCQAKASDIKLDGQRDKVVHGRECAN
jgi:hypothetical protein